MNNMKTKTNKIRNIRYIVQVIGVLLTVLGFFTGYPIASTILLGISFIMGPVFCGWICPFGTLQDLFSKIGKRLGIKKRVLPAKLHTALSFSRYILFLATVLISTDFIFSLLSLDPRSNFTTFLGGNAITVIGWSVIAIFLSSALFFERPFCNYLCIEGAKNGLLSALRPITILRNEETCIGCNKCNRVCPMNVDVASHDQVRSLHCINCMSCVSACPVKNTLTFGLIPVKKKINKVILTLMTITVLSAASLVAYTKSNSNLNVSSNVAASDNSNLSESSSALESDNSDLSESSSTVASDKSNLSESSSTVASDNSDLSESSSTVASDNSDLSESSSTVASSNSESTTMITGESAAQMGDAAGIADGVYEGTGTGFRGDMTVAVTVENEQITGVEVTAHSDDAKWFNRAYNTVVSSIISSQTAQVDSVSGATYSSMGIKEAVANALINGGGENVEAIVNDMPQNNNSHGRR